MKQPWVLILLLGIYACTSTQRKDEVPRANKKEEVPRHVGDIAFDAAIDTTNFKPCHEDLALQYYNFGKAIQYEGEKTKIVRQFDAQYKPVATEEDGYVTIRFLVNCEGKTGRFRTVELDENYLEKKMNPQITNQLLNITASLDGWIVGTLEGRKYDYYQYLTFKITDGDIENIMP